MKVSDEEIAKDYAKNNSKIKISYILIPVDSFTSKVSVSDEEIKNFYEARKNDFVLNEKIIDAKKPEDTATPKKTATFEEAKELSKTYHRSSLTPGQDLTNVPSEVVSVCNLIWTSEVIADYQAQHKEF